MLLLRRTLHTNLTLVRGYVCLYVCVRVTDCPFLYGTRRANEVENYPNAFDELELFFFFSFITFIIIIITTTECTLIHFTFFSSFFFFLLTLLYSSTSCCCVWRCGLIHRPLE